MSCVKTITQFRQDLCTFYLEVGGQRDIPSNSLHFDGISRYRKSKKNLAIGMSMFRRFKGLYYVSIYLASIIQFHFLKQ